MNVLLVYYKYILKSYVLDLSVEGKSYSIYCCIGIKVQF